MRNDDGTKWLTAKRLIELLSTLPEHSRVVPNAVGNLTVISDDGKRYVGLVDFLPEQGGVEYNEDADGKPPPPAPPATAPA